MSLVRSRMPRLLGALLATILVVGLLGGCGASSQSAPQPSQSSAPKASESSKPAASSQPSASASAPASAPAAPKDPIKIGVILTTSGPIGPIGNKQMMGLTMAVEDINAAGGIMGRKVELIQRDDAGDPTKALTTAQELVEKQGVTLVVASTLSSPALAILPYFTEQKVFSLGSQTSDAANDPKKYPYGFTAQPLASVQAQVVVRYAVDVMKVSKVGILVEATAMGKSTADAYKKELEGKGLQPVAVEQIPQGAQDVTAQLNNLRKAGSEMLMTATLGADSVRIIKNLKTMGWDVPMLGNSDLFTAVVVDGAGPENMQKVYAYNPARLSFSDKTPPPAKAKEFAAKLAKRLNLPTLKDAFQQESVFYDIMYIIKAGVEKAQSTEGPKVAAAVETFKGFDGVQAAYTFDKDSHAGQRVDQEVLIKAASLKEGFFEMAPGY
ncbi:MAG: ABC transporter substrate-binding protein [Chloroflexota bacterium]|nr:MAG: ABC transporter substrate-binding protein [Chloroflexota bacterium]